MCTYIYIYRPSLEGDQVDSDLGHSFGVTALLGGKGAGWRLRIGGDEGERLKTGKSLGVCVGGGGEGGAVVC